MRAALFLAISLPLMATGPNVQAKEGMVTADGTKPSLLSWLGAPRPAERKASQKLTREHSVSVYEFVRIEDILAPGEVMPDPVFHKLYVTSRAPMRMIAYCDDVIETIGLLCDVGAPNVRDWGDGRYEITARLYYRPSFDMGERKLVRGGGWQTGTVDLGGNRRSDDTAPIYSTGNRRAALERVRDICGKLVAQYGTCVPASIKFNRAGYFGAESEEKETRMSVSVNVNVYAMQSEKSYREIQAAIRDAAGPDRSLAATPQSGISAAGSMSSPVRHLILLAVARQIGDLDRMTRLMARPWQTLPALIARSAM
ncbi:hypothetical protein R3X27_01715 [Tropicimonas sp. TH_r6]|uniref:hypothetical protein n=1 Tax=Tropicimonas sp. TH_r6 TaxID=3082085 RepID=UPI00295493C8|nr:hypothetical protein [Tropicimonas sp. TH_r6]MDV7141392.1 hypothetical protein [Tropicimonas sp. TH_r6]